MTGKRNKAAQLTHCSAARWLRVGLKICAGPGRDSAAPVSQGASESPICIDHLSRLSFIDLNVVKHFEDDLQNKSYNLEKE